MSEAEEKKIDAVAKEVQPDQSKKDIEIDTKKIEEAQKEK